MSDFDAGRKYQILLVRAQKVREALRELVVKSWRPEGPYDLYWQHKCTLCDSYWTDDSERHEPECVLAPLESEP